MINEQYQSKFIKIGEKSYRKDQIIGFGYEENLIRRKSEERTKEKQRLQKEYEDYRDRHMNLFKKTLDYKYKTAPTNIFGIELPKPWALEEKVAIEEYAKSNACLYDKLYAWTRYEEYEYTRGFFVSFVDENDDLELDAEKDAEEIKLWEEALKEL